jgi:hypothetical protein
MYIKLACTNDRKYLYSCFIATHFGLSLLREIPWPAVKITVTPTFEHHRVA